MGLCFIVEEGGRVYGSDRCWFDCSVGRGFERSLEVGFCSSNWKRVGVEDI